jgi:hypothetical protein
LLIPVPVVLEVRFIVVVGSDLFLIGGFVLRRRFRVFVFSSSDEEPEDVRQSGTGAVFNRRFVFRLRQRANLMGVIPGEKEVFESEKDEANEI